MCGRACVLVLYRPRYSVVQQVLQVAGPAGAGGAAEKNAGPVSYEYGNPKEKPIISQ